MQLNHRQRKIESIALGLLDDRAIEIERRHILRRGRRDDPAVVADRNENADVQFVQTLFRLADGHPKGLADAPRDLLWSATGRFAPNEEFSSLADKRCMGVETVGRLNSQG